MESQTSLFPSSVCNFLWWRQETAKKHLKATLKYISASAWDRQQRESGRHGGGEGG